MHVGVVINKLMYLLSIHQLLANENKHFLFILNININFK